MMELSIIIVNWNVRDYLRDCLKSIFENLNGVSFEVIVIDNNSPDKSAEMVKREFPEVKLIANNVNTYFAKGNNIGYKMSCGNYIAFLNPDAIIHPNTIETAIAYLRTYHKVGAVSCKFLNPDGSFQREYYRRFPDLSTVFFCFTLVGVFIDKNFLKRKYENIYFYNDKNFDQIEKIDQPGATFIVTTRAVLNKIGVFNEEFPIFFNDVDLCKRIWGSGYEIHILHDVVITHYGGKGVKQLGWTAYRYFLIGCYRYFRKYHGITSAFLVIILLSTNLLVAPVVTIISEYILNVKRHGINKTNKKAVKFILNNIKPAKENK